MTDQQTDVLVFKKRIYLIRYVFVVAYVSVCGAILIFLPPEMFSPWTLLPGFLVFLVFLFCDFLRACHRLEFNDQLIIMTGIFSHQQMRRSDIKGVSRKYDLHKRYIKTIVFKPNQKGLDDLKIHPTTYADMMNLFELIEKRFKDLG